MRWLKHGYLGFVYLLLYLPIGVLVVAILMAALSVGGDQISITMRLPASVAEVLQGAILFFVLGGEIFVRYRLRVVRPMDSAQ